MKRMLCMILVLLVTSMCYAENDTEEIALTTYYPAPYGEYDGLQTNRLAVGATTTIPSSDGVIKLEPLSNLPTNPSQGDIYYEDGTNNPEGLYFYSGSNQWVLCGGASSSPIGTIGAFGGAIIPDGWLLCNGDAVNRVTYKALYDCILETWGAGNGITTFNLPDLRGRTLIGSGEGPGLTNRILGVKPGEEEHLLTISEMPSHTHEIRGTSSASDRGRNTTGKSSNNSILETLPEGGGQPHNNMQPSAVINYIIKY